LVNTRLEIKTNLKNSLIEKLQERERDLSLKIKEILIQILGICNFWNWMLWLLLRRRDYCPVQPHNQIGNYYRLKFNEVIINKYLNWNDFKARLTP
jgi:hypothetical protein